MLVANSFLKLNVRGTIKVFNQGDYVKNIPDHLVDELYKANLIKEIQEVKKAAEPAINVVEAVKQKESKKLNLKLQDKSFKMVEENKNLEGEKQ